MDRHQGEWLVRELIFEADLPPEQYAYRPGRNDQQVVMEVEATLLRGHPEAVAPRPDSTERHRRLKYSEWRLFSSLLPTRTQA